MNPDFHKTAETITWTLIDSNGNVVTFKVSPGRVLIQDGDEWRGVDKEKGRRIYKEYMDKGFRVHNKCVDHNMKKFNRAKRREEEIRKIHYADLQEMRVNPKKLYTDNWDNYALQA